MPLDCPNCGANIHIVGTETARCSFCGTRVSVPQKPDPASRRALEAEREQIRTRESEWNARIKEAGRRGAGDFIYPPIGCCGIYFGLFVAGMLILGAIGKAAQKEYGTAVAGIAIFSAIVGAIFIAVQRERARARRMLALDRERSGDRHLREERLREIEAELEALGE